MGNYTTSVQNLIMEFATNEQDHVLGIQYYLGMSQLYKLHLSWQRFRLALSNRSLWHTK